MPTISRNPEFACYEGVQPGNRPTCKLHARSVPLDIFLVEPLRSRKRQHVTKIVTLTRIVIAKVTKIVTITKKLDKKIVCNNYAK